MNDPIQSIDMSCVHSSQQVSHKQLNLSQSFKRKANIAR